MNNKSQESYPFEGTISYQEYQKSSTDYNVLAHWRDHKNPNVRKNFNTAYNFYTKEAGLSKKEALNHMKGINFRSDYQVKVVTLTDKNTSVFKQYSPPEHDKVGNYFAPVNSDRPKLGIEGISSQTKQRNQNLYFIKKGESLKALQSTARDISNWNPQNDELLYGGGKQYFISDREKGKLSPLFNSPSSKPTNSLDKKIGHLKEKPATTKSSTITSPKSNKSSFPSP